MKRKVFDNQIRNAVARHIRYHWIMQARRLFSRVNRNKPELPDSLGIDFLPILDYRKMVLTGSFV